MGSVVEFKKKDAPEEVTTDAKEEDKKEESFEEIMKRNKENADRIRKERLQQNKSVLTSYRIK